jgi:hypothetical protein
MNPVRYLQSYFLKIRLILWRIDPLQSKDLEINNKTTAVTTQRRDKHALTKIELLLEKVFSVWFTPRNYLEDNCGVVS